jgi:hemolysin activation/secretion protein
VQSRNKITGGGVQNLGLQSQSEIYEVSVRQPLIRSLNQEFAISAGVLLQGGQTFVFNDTPFPFGIGPDKNGISRTRVLQFSQDYTRRDATGAWALRSQFSLGLNILGATSNPDPIPDGSFFSWLGQGQRVQRLGKDNLLIVQSELQLSPNSLLPFHQFAIGGGQSVRGYRQSSRSGDNGFRFSVEGRFPVLRNRSKSPVLQLAPFVDVGAVWNNSRNPNGQVSQGVLGGAGLGLLIQPVSNLDIRLDYALPFVNLSDRGSSFQDQAFYFSLTLRP